MLLADFVCYTIIIPGKLLPGANNWAIYGHNVYLTNNKEYEKRVLHFIIIIFNPDFALVLTEKDDCILMIYFTAFWLAEDIIIFNVNLSYILGGLSSHGEI